MCIMIDFEESVPFLNVLASSPCLLCRFSIKHRKIYKSEAISEKNSETEISLNVFSVLLVTL